MSKKALSLVLALAAGENTSPNIFFDFSIPLKKLLCDQ